MASMNNDEEDQTTAAFSWWWDSHVGPQKSQWLQNTVSDLDEKKRAMLNLIQGDGDSFAERADMYYKRRPELIKMVEDLHKSYRSLAEKYGQLRSESIQAAYPRSLPLSTSFKQVQVLQNCDKGIVENTKLGSPTSHPEPEKNPDLETEKSNMDIESLNKLADELMSSYINGDESYGSKGGYSQMGSLEREKMWNELRSKVSKLIEDNLRQQQKLIRRNDEKREVIKDLCSQVNRLKDENRALKCSLPNHNVDVKRSQSHGSRLKELLLKKFTC